MGDVERLTDVVPARHATNSLYITRIVLLCVALNSPGCQQLDRIPITDNFVCNFVCSLLEALVVIAFLVNRIPLFLPLICFILLTSDMNKRVLIFTSRFSVMIAV